jgi:hypothetical protein
MGQRSGRSAVLAVAAVCLLLAGIGAYARFAVLDEGNFADRATSTLVSDEVRDEIGARVGARVVAERPELAAGEAAVEDAVAEGVTTDLAFHAAFHTAAARWHHGLLSDADGDVPFVVAGSGATLRQELVARMPALSGRLPRLGDPPLMSIGGDGDEHALRELAPVARDLALPATILAGLAGLALLALGVVAWPDRRRGLWGAGLAVAAAGGLIAAGMTAAKDIVLTHFDTSVGDAVVSQIWNAYLGDLRTWGLAVAAAGLVVAAAAGGPRPSPRALLTGPATRFGRLLRATGLVALAALAVTVPELLLHIGLVTLAAVFVYVAAGDLLRVLAPPQGAARGLRGAATAAALLVLIAVAAVPASGTEPLPARVSVPTPAKAGKAAKNTATKPAPRAKTREVCVTAEEERWLTAQGVAPPADAYRRADGRLCSKRP